MKKLYIPLLLCCTLSLTAQHTVSGYVITEENSLPLSGATVNILNSKTVIITDKDGFFKLPANGEKVTLNISHSGYKSVSLAVALPLDTPLRIVLSHKVNDIQEVNISTGYQKIPKERATGSFTFTDNQLLNQQVSTNILDRLANVAGGVLLERGRSGNPQLMVRGLSTINGPKSPLIVVDNFPYEGDISNINPNMVESITVLKDASAASIWGARAANGVIVITTKTGKFNQPVKVEFNFNTSYSPKPDFGYLKTMSSSDFIEVEKGLFQKGFYNSDINSSSHPVLSPVVDLLNKAKSGLISSDEADRQIQQLSSIDAKEQFSRYMYTPSEKRQYYVGITGGAPAFLWSTALGYDDNTGNLGEDYNRMNLRFQNVWKPTNKISVTSSLYYTETNTKSGRTAYGGIIMGRNSFVPYMQLADEIGRPLVVNKDYNQNYKDSFEKGKLNDWNYYPLTDWQNDQIKTKASEVMVNAGIKYKIWKGLEADVKYQHQRLNDNSDNLHNAQSYYARNYVNSFAQINNGNVTFIVPKGGILDQSASLTTISNIRGQLSYSGQWNRHNISAIAGGESRDAVRNYNYNRYYGFDQDRMTSGAVDYAHQYPLLPTGSTDFIQRNQSLGKRTTRFVSLYANAAYTYDNRYTVSASFRRDASNLFGLKTNDQWNPFWSVGTLWDISKENFYNIAWLPTLKLRGSFGYNGNIDPAMVAVSTIAYDLDNSVYTGTPMARIDNYYNPNLRWETSRMFNIGIDFSSRNNRISGSVEYFTKKGTNLFGPAQMDYTKGIDYMRSNVAEIKGKGMDIVLKTLNIDKGIQWNTILNFSIYHDKISKYYLLNPMANQFIGNGSSVPISGIEGRPVYSIFAYQWAGLDPNTGDPRGYLNGAVSKDYAALTGAGTSVNDLVFFGSALPTSYGSFINSVGYQNFSLDIGIVFKLGYYFRRSSINYTNLYRSWTGHSDFADRWQKEGDEAFTDVPSNTLQSNANRDAFYNGSSVLVEKADHIRLQYINLNYRFNKHFLGSSMFKDLSLFVNLSDLGLLWKANKSGIDPDFNLGGNGLKPPSVYTIGLRANF
ncbi:SusC/RagA family TonB-linked outer membrane protein [Chryseobacterium sp.]|uniref:SusC/RagA family TonB-linked outer membrane protein n=1 Tax=Chryseobacterium sp. TaxID=1871047 RepID=UPI0023F43AE4|nr:SusC/RagA family TonB-linked outer membrane protein [Chryseobacterium sp.]